MAVKLETKTNKRRVVLVDDEADLLELYKDILGQFFNVMVFLSPNEFLTFMDETLAESKELPFDILVSDFKMPGMSGVQMLQKAYAKGTYFPALILSGHLSKESIMDGLESGVMQFLEKPVPPLRIVENIQQLLVEQDLRKVREEIHDLASQLREYFSYLRLVVESNQSETDVVALQTDQRGRVIAQERQDELFNSLEKRIESLFESEKTLQNLRSGKYRKVA